MYGLKLISNGYIPDGTGRDTYMTRDKEVTFGRSQPAPYRTASLGRQSQTIRRMGVPTAPSRRRLQQMQSGERVCTSEAARSSAKKPSPASLHSMGPAWESSMSVWCNSRAVGTKGKSSGLRWLTKDGSTASGNTLPRASSVPSGELGLGSLLQATVGDDHVPWGAQAADDYGYYMDGRKSPFRSSG
eukprot:TRINITY_DN30188_c0_g1_i1.p1 TRINITY_DN30188_c0_g1~~TRINITY_DN30188_c0_g1_i1.p1  ORF type:complete len:202 (+),score=38.15 TRINITY_DN30188_c0_g1_i1:46-606(+)